MIGIDRQGRGTGPLHSGRRGRQRLARVRLAMLIVAQDEARHVRRREHARGGRARVGDQEHGRRVVEDTADPLGRVVGVDRQVRGTGPVHGQRGHREVGATPEGEGDGPLGSAP